MNRVTSAMNWGWDRPAKSSNEVMRKYMLGCGVVESLT